MLTKPVLGVLATRATETSEINGNCAANRRVANFPCAPGLGHGRGCLFGCQDIGICSNMHTRVLVEQHSFLIHVV